MTVNTPLIYNDPLLAEYNFGNEHPFGPDRYHAYASAFAAEALSNEITVGRACLASDEDILRFHTSEYLTHVKGCSATGIGYLDGGDTPSFKGVYESAARVVGTTLAAAHALMCGEYKRTFVPIAGLHHARRDSTAGFCVFNDCGVVIEVLRQQYGVRKIAYVDIDAHHGDGVFYSFEDDAHLCFVDFHEDGRFLYPGTGTAAETGIAKAKDTKLNIPMPMGATDDMFLQAWPAAETFIRKAQPEIILLQAGVDSLAGDPITHMQYSEQAHAYATERLCKLANIYSEGRILAMGGGGYNLDNIARGWCAVVKSLINTE